MVDIAVVDYGMGNLRSVQQALLTVAPGVSIAVTHEPHEVALAARVVFPGQGAMPDCMRELDVRGLRPAVLEAARSKPFLGICIGLQMLFEHSDEGDIPGLGILPGKVVRFASNLRDAQGCKLKVPHMGWNQVHRIDSDHPIPEEVGTVALSPSGRKLDRGASALPLPNPLMEPLAIRLSPQAGKSLVIPVGEGAMAASTAGGSQKIDAHPLWQGISQDARFYFVHSYYVQPQDETLVQATSCYPEPFVCAVAQDNIFAVQFHPEKSQSAGLALLRNFVKWNPV